MIPYNKKLKEISQRLRSNMTDSERLLWSRVRRKQLKGLQFYRQKIVGDYIVDFCCPGAKVVIEVDGGQHYTEEGLKKDTARDDFLNKQGFKVLRFSDREVLKDIDVVVEMVFANL